MNADLKLPLPCTACGEPGVCVDNRRNIWCYAKDRTVEHDHWWNGTRVGPFRRERR